MDRTQPVEFVLQLPRRTYVEVCDRDTIADKQMLLHENWSDFAVRQGYDMHRADEEHVKWATETWSEYEQRSIQRDVALSDYFKQTRLAESAASAAQQLKTKTSHSVVDQLMERENAIRNAKVASVHTLFVDFEERQLLKMQSERETVEKHEADDRSCIGSEEKSSRCAVEETFAEALQCVIDLLEARRRAKEEEEQRLLEEQRRKAEELRQLEEQRKRDAEAAEKARREAEEEAKRAERKRREEERKNKAKAEREARARQTKADQDLSATTTAPTDVVEAEAKPSQEEVIPKAAVVEATTALVSPVLPTFSAIDGSTVAQLLGSATVSLRVLEFDVYIIQCDATSTVLAHNGSVLGNAQHGLVGKSIDSGLSLSSSKLHLGAAWSSTDDFIQSRVETIANVSTDERCVSFTGQAKPNEALLMIPVDDDRGKAGRFVVAVSSADSTSLLQKEMIQSLVEKVLQEFAPKLRVMLAGQRAQILGTQALEWLSITTASKNCYFAISDEPKAPGSLKFVASTESQRFLVGKTCTKAEEATDNVGVSFALIDEALKTGQPEVAHISNVLDKTTNKVNGNELRFFGSKKAGSLLMCPVIRPAHPGQGEVFGMLYVDTMDDEKVLNKADEDIIRTTAALLADLLCHHDGSQVQGAVKLSLEHELFEGIDASDSPIQFLKHIWLKVNADISSISSGQLQELATYNHPPPIIPTTVSATLLVALGTNPKNLDSWDEIRKRIKPSLIEKIVAFDPSDATRRKKSFYTRARKVTKGLSAHDVFTRGSYPASCFFTWTFVTILIRRTSDAFRVLYKDAPNKIPLVLMQRLPGEQPEEPEDEAPADEPKDETRDEDDA